MKNITKQLILLLLAALLFGTVLTACGEDPTPTPRAANDDDDGDPPPDEDEDTEEPTEEPEPTDEPDPTEEPTPEPTEEPTPEPTADPAAGFTTFSNEILGVDLSYPGDWAIEFDEIGGELKLASSQELLEDSDDNIEGAIFNVLFLNKSDLESDPELDAEDPVQILTLFADFFAQPSEDGINITITQEPTAVTINGQSAAEVVADAIDEEGDSAVMKISVVLGETRGAIVLAGSETSEEAQNRPLLDAITNSIVLSTPVGEPETVDPGNGNLPESQGFLLYGDVINSSVDETGPSIWDFIGLEGESIDIIVEPEGDFDVVVDVLNESGASILPNGEVDASFGTEEIRELVIPNSGLFYISVRGFADAIGNYTLTIVESGSPVTPIEGPGTTIGYGETVSGQVDSANPIASFSFTGSADDVAGAIVTPANGFDIVVDVIDSVGNSLLALERDASYTAENVLFVLPADGVYTIQVYGFDSTTSGSFEVQLAEPFANVVFAAPDTLEPDDEGSGHSFPFTALRAGDMVGIYAEPAEGLDIAVQVSKGDQLLGEEVGIDSSLDGNDAERGFDNAIDAEEFVMVAFETGTYTFRVLNSQDEDFGGNTGDYEVTLFGTTEVIFELAYGDYVDARTNSEGLIDYVISGAPGESMVVNVQSDDDSIDLVLEILDLDENVLASVDDGFSGEPEELIYTFENEDLVLIRVRDFSGGVGDFIMAVDSQ